MTHLLAQIGEPGHISQKTTVRLWNVVLCIDAGIVYVWKGGKKKLNKITGKVVANGIVLLLPGPAEGLGSAEGEGLEVGENYSEEGKNIPVRMTVFVAESCFG